MKINDMESVKEVWVIRFNLNLIECGRVGYFKEMCARSLSLAEH